MPIDFELYLPKSWTDDAPRRAAARIPESVTFKTKPELALDMIVRAIEDEIPGEVLLADTAYGDSVAFRQGVTCYGLDYAVAVSATTSVWLLDGQGHRRGESVQVQQLGLTLGESAFRRITWRNGTRSGPRGKLHSRFVFRRVKVAHDDGTDPRNRAAEWLVIEWPEGEPKPTKFFLTTLRRSMSKKHVVRTIKERWKVEVFHSSCGPCHSPLCARDPLVRTPAELRSGAKRAESREFVSIGEDCPRSVDLVKMSPAYPAAA